MPAPYAALHDEWMQRYRIVQKSRLLGKKRLLQAKHRDGYGLFMSKPYCIVAWTIYWGGGIGPKRPNFSKLHAIPIADVMLGFIWDFFCFATIFELYENF